VAAVMLLPTVVSTVAALLLIETASAIELLPIHPSTTSGKIGTESSVVERTNNDDDEFTFGLSDFESFFWSALSMSF
jgi:hypothetical protein